MIREGGRGARGAAGRGTRRALVIAEVTLGFVLLTAAGLMILTFYRLQQVNPGFDPAHVLTFELQPRGPDAKSAINFVAECERRLKTLRGVQAVGAISHLPLDDYPNWYSPFHPEGITDQESKGMLADHRAITPGYFRAMSARLLDGRMFDEHDSATTQPVVIVDDLLARDTWPGQSAVGKRLTVERSTFEGFANVHAQVVGVIEHIQHHSLTRAVRGQIYLPYAQSPREHLSFAVRASGDPLALVAPVRRELRAVNKDVAIAKVLPMTSYVHRAAAPVNFIAVIATAFGGLGLLLAAVGVYSVISYTVSQRTQEFGVRMAVGAAPWSILRLVMREGLLLTAVGIAIGAGCALLLTRYLQTLLFGVTAVNPAAYAGAGAVIAVAALVACWRPAARAARGSVSEALRLE